jgi:hypothetical protein
MRPNLRRSRLERRPDLRSRAQTSVVLVTAPQVATRSYTATPCWAGSYSVAAGRVALRSKSAALVTSRSWGAAIARVARRSRTIMRRRSANGASSRTTRRSMSESGPSDPAATEPEQNDAYRIEFGNQGLHENIGPGAQCQPCPNGAIVTHGIVHLRHPPRYRTNPPMVRPRPRDQRRLPASEGAAAAALHIAAAARSRLGRALLRCTDTACKGRSYGPTSSVTVASRTDTQGV